MDINVTITSVFIVTAHFYASFKATPLFYVQM